MVVIFKGLVEFAALILLGQGLVYLLSFGRHETNAVYRFFRLLSSPVVRSVRVITPKQVADRHLPMVGFFLLFWLWFGLLLAKAAIFIPSSGTLAG
ncbi:MAG: hypothetical protein ACO3ST_08265 [Burkholderiaceae bacterium]